MNTKYASSICLSASIRISEKHLHIPNFIDYSHSHMYLLNIILKFYWLYHYQQTNKYFRFSFSSINKHTTSMYLYDYYYDDDYIVMYKMCNVVYTHINVFYYAYYY